MPSKGPARERLFDRPLREVGLGIAAALLSVVALRFFVSSATAPVPYAPVESSRVPSPDELDSDVPFRLSEKFWIGMTLAEAEAVLKGHNYWYLQPADVGQWRFSPRDQFPRLPESMAWYETGREGAWGGIKFGFSDGVLIYKTTYGYRGKEPQLVPEAAAEVHSDEHRAKREGPARQP